MTKNNFCPECGAKLADSGHKFCSLCGHPLNPQSQSHNSSEGLIYDVFAGLEGLGFGLYNEGQFNVEGGMLNIASELFPKCDCDTNSNEFICDLCGRSSKSFTSMRSGPGDGIYAISTIFRKSALETTVDDIFGAIVVLDYQFSNEKNFSWQSLPPHLDLQLFDFGIVETLDRIHIGENDAIVPIQGRLGDYHVVAFSEVNPHLSSPDGDAVKSTIANSLQDILTAQQKSSLSAPMSDLPNIVPYAVLILHDDAWQEIIKVLPFSPAPINKFECGLAWAMATVMANPVPVANYAYYNNYFSSAWSKDVQISWLLAGELINDEDCIDLLQKEIDDGYQLNPIKRIELLSLRGFYERASEVFESIAQPTAEDRFAYIENTLIPSRQYPSALHEISMVETEVPFMKYRLLCFKTTALDAIGKTKEALEAGFEAMKFAESAMPEVAQLLLPFSLNAYATVVLNFGQRERAKEIFLSVASNTGMEGRKAKYLASKL